MRRYNANDNMVKRNKGLSGEQTLVWDDENRLSQVQDDQGNLLERYWYGAAGMRVKKTSGSTTTYTFFGHYEEEVTDGVTTAVSYYSFGGLRIAVKRGNTLFHLHGDHLGSTSLTTRGSSETASRADYAYGAERSASGDLKTDHTFTGQKRDATGLMYYNACYYDPALGTFISPDSMVPGAGQVINYNRFLYARGNPFKYSDPSRYASDPSGVNTGECSTQECWEERFKWNERWYRAHGYEFNGTTNRWTDRISESADFADMEILTDVLTEAGISTEGNWTFDKLKPLGQGVVEFGCKIGRLLDAGVTAGFDQLKTLFDSEVTWKLTAPTGRCRRGSYACTVSRNEVHFYNNLYTDWQQSTIREVAIHELAHIIHFNCNRGAANCPPIAGKAKRYRFSQYNPIKRYRRFISHFAWGSIDEYWAEAVTVWVYRNAYWETGAPSNIDDTKERPYIVDIFSWVEENLIP